MKPKLKFMEFNSDWNKTTLKNIAIINPKNETLPDKFIYIDLESVNKGILSQEKIISKSDAPSRAQRTIKKNDILFQTVRPYQQNNYFVKEINDLPYVASTGYALIRTKENPYFIYSLLHKKEFLDKVIDRCTGTSFPAISSTDLADININIPDIQEQTKVSNFLSLLDKKIELQSKKIEDLKLFKSYTKNQLFSNGEKVVKLKDILIKWNEKNKDGSIDYVESISNKHGFISQSDQFDDRNVASKDLKNYYVIRKNVFGYNPSRLNVGSLALKENDNTSVVSPLYECFTTTQNNKFMLEWFDSKYFRKGTLSKFEGGVRNTLNFTNLCEIEINLPPLGKQNKFANYLYNFDKKIQLEELKLNKLNMMKKGLMQNMFV